MKPQVDSFQPSELDISFTTLWSLFVLIDQNFIALYNYRGLIDNIDDLETEENISLSTIREALVYQILLKSCAFIDEWDKHLGHKTELEYFDEIIKVKKVLKPARRILDRWKGLRQFRNQAIAHGNRDEKGNHIYYRNKKFYHTPETIGDLAYLIFAIEKMVKILAEVFPKQLEIAVKINRNAINTKYNLNDQPDKDLSKENIVKDLMLATKDIRENLQEASYSFFDVTSNYLELLKNSR